MFGGFDRGSKLRNSLACGLVNIFAGQFFCTPGRGWVVLLFWLKELMDNTVSIVPANPFGEDGLVGKVQINEALAQGVPSAFLLKELL